MPRRRFATCKVGDGVNSPYQSGFVRAWDKCVAGPTLGTAFASSADHALSTCAITTTSASPLLLSAGERRTGSARSASKRARKGVLPASRLPAVARVAAPLSAAVSVPWPQREVGVVAKFRSSASTQAAAAAGRLTSHRRGGGAEKGRGWAQSESYTQQRMHRLMGRYNHACTRVDITMHAPINAVTHRRPGRGPTLPPARTPPSRCRRQPPPAPCTREAAAAPPGLAWRARTGPQRVPGGANCPP